MMFWPLLLHAISIFHVLLFIASHIFYNIINLKEILYRDVALSPLASPRSELIERYTPPVSHSYLIITLDDGVH